MFIANELGQGGAAPLAGVSSCATPPTAARRERPARAESAA